MRSPYELDHTGAYAGKYTLAVYNTNIKGVPKTIHITHQKHHKQVADGSEVMQPEHDIV